MLRVLGVFEAGGAVVVALGGAVPVVLGGASLLTVLSLRLELVTLVSW